MSTDHTIAEAFARAWHPIACLHKSKPFDTCTYRSQHEHTGRMAILELAKDGYSVVRNPVEVESVPMFGEDAP